MPVSRYLRIEPWSRVNDRFVTGDQIDAQPITKSVKHPLITSLPNSMSDRWQPGWYQHIACDIVVETVFDYPYAYISEKTLRPISCKRMFIVVGPAGILSHLRSKGFQTFDDFVDEDYDSITDPTQRFLAVIDQIYRFCDRPLDEVMQYLTSNRSRLEHNFENLMSLHNKELHDLERRLT